MQQTYQTRMNLHPTSIRWMDEFARHYGIGQRKLYACIAKGDEAGKIKPQFCKEHGLSARQFNAMRMELEGKISSTVELLKLRKNELKQSISAVARSIKKIEALLKPAPTKKLSAKKKDKLSNQLFGKRRRLLVLQGKFRAVEQRLKSAVPGICFGSRKLFNQQFHLEKAGYAPGIEGHAQWRRDWLASRSSQFLLVGSKGETGGNQSCKATLGPEGVSLSLKMPPALVTKGAPAFLMIGGIKFQYGQEAFESAIRANTALSYRFYRDNGTATGWRVFVSTNVAEAPKTSIPAQYGVLGIDFNADHLAWSEVDRFGNMIDFGRADMHVHGKSTDQREAVISEAIDAVFKVAQERNLGVSIEDLDFASKKKELKSMGVKRARMLAGLAYAKFRQLAQSKASRKGIALHIIDPAYTSVAGSVKYAARIGCTVHQAASGVIARRAQGYSEKLPKAGAQRAPLMGRTAALTLPARNRDEKARQSWAVIRKCLTQHFAEQVRLRKKSSSNRDKNRKDGSMHLLNSRTKNPGFRESGELLARRRNQFPDVPF